MIKKVYLGDGLYASDEGGMIALTCERENGLNTVYLESEVLAELILFIERVRGVKITVAKASKETRGA